jgi:hypothetical protein
MNKFAPAVSIATLTMLGMLWLATAQTAPAISPAISTPDKVETRLGTLDFKDGAPSAATVAKVYDNLDFAHALDVFVNTFQGASTAAIRKGFLDIGVKDNEVLVFSKLMDAKSLFLTANADTVYFVGVIDLNKGPMVFETPPGALGALDDMWWRWVIDFGRPGPDRGLRGKYLLLPPEYDGPVPEGGFFVAHAKTNRVIILGREFIENNDPKPAADLIRKTTKIYPYEQGGAHHAVASGMQNPLLTFWHARDLVRTASSLGCWHGRGRNDALSELSLSRATKRPASPIGGISKNSELTRAVAEVQGAASMSTHQR